MIPNLEAFCLEFAAMVDIEKVLYFHGLMITGTSAYFIANDSLVYHEENFVNQKTLCEVAHKEQSRAKWRMECSLVIFLHPTGKRAELLK